jgi:hypothetical protein
MAGTGLSFAIRWSLGHSFIAQQRSTRYSRRSLWQTARNSPDTSAHTVFQLQLYTSMTHAQLVERAVRWLRSYRCGVVLSEQACVSGEMPDAIGWKRASHSVLVECKTTRADFLADRAKPFRLQPEQGVGSERFYLTPPALVKVEELPAGWGLLEYRRARIEMVHRSAKNLRTATGFRYEMNLLLASLRRVEVRIEPQSITDFLKWKNRMAEYNRGSLPEGITAAEEELNVFLEPEASPQ